MGRILIKDMTSKKIYVIVSCKDCLKKWSKRKDSLQTWLGRCKSCASKELEKSPAQIAMKKKNGLNFFAKYGKLPNHNNRRKGEDHHFFGKKRTGENAANWIDGRTPEHERIRHSKEYKEWRLSVFERDKFTCVNCGDDKGGNLNADHIKPFCLYPELRLDVDNGRTLCESCHIQIGWSILGHKHNGTNWVVF